MLSDQAPNNDKEVSNPDVWSDDESDDSTVSCSSSGSSLGLPPLPVLKKDPVSKKKPCQKAVKTKGELSLEELPPIENLTISVEESEIKEIGKVYAIIEKLVVVRSFKDERPLDLDSILFLSSEKPLGKIFDVFGPIGEPFYSVRFNSSEEISEKEIEVDAPVFFAPSRPEPITRYVFVEQIQNEKGSDASWTDNNEPPEEHLDYSDDEKESIARKQRKNRYAVKNSEDISSERLVSSSNEPSAVHAPGTGTTFTRNPPVTFSKRATSMRSELWRPSQPLQVVNPPYMFLQKPPSVFRFNAVRSPPSIPIGPPPVPSPQNISPFVPIPDLMRSRYRNRVDPNPINQQISWPANQAPMLMNQQNVNQLSQNPAQYNFSQFNHNTPMMNQQNPNQMFKNPTSQFNGNSSQMSNPAQYNFSQVNNDTPIMNQQNPNQMFKNPTSQFNGNSSQMSNPAQYNFSQINHDTSMMNQQNPNQMFKNSTNQFNGNSSEMIQQNQWNSGTQRYSSQNMSQTNQRNIPMNQHSQGYIQTKHTGPYDAPNPDPHHNGPASHSLHPSYPVMPRQALSSNPWSQNSRPIRSSPSPTPSANWFRGPALSASPAPNAGRNPMPPCSPLSIQIPGNSGAPSSALGPFSFQLLPRPSPGFFPHAGQNPFFKH